MTTVEAPHASHDEIYDPEDVGLRDSPLLKAHKPKLEPTPSPEPEIPDSPPPDSPNSRKPARRTKPRPSPGDAVLINLLGGGKALEVSRTAAKELLASDDDMSDAQSSKGVEVNMKMDTDSADGDTNDLAALAMGALKFVQTSPVVNPSPVKAEDPISPTDVNGTNGYPARQPLPSVPMDSAPTMRRRSPNIKGPDELAPMREVSPKPEKPGAGFTLPSITSQLGDIKQLAEAANPSVSGNKDSLTEHRPSISSLPHSPPGPPLFSASHLAGHGSPPISPNDTFRRELPSPSRILGSNAGPYYYSADVHRPHEGQLYPQGPTPTDYGSSPTETPSTDQSGPSPGGLPVGIDRMSIDGITNPQIGGFHCTYPGCNAQPFQTQYLLNSHANVHSSNRPHYCPVKSCPRAEGGKGFKRKNEMIRHGLVHESPGYVCPYCQDREHKYPRPDNLQRHVRVHHVDKDKDDPLLRDVLAQRPTGPSRGRRRRGGNTS